MTRSKSWLSVLIFGALILLTLLVLAETFFRLYPRHMSAEWQIKLQSKARKHRTIPDPEIGFLLEPRQRQWIHTLDFEYFKETDAYGFPNRDPWPERIDILFLGDSMIVGEGVGYDGNFSTLLARDFPEKKILNLGLPGADPERQYRIYRRFGVPRHPSLVVSAIYLESDLDNALHFRAWLKERNGTDYNDFRLRFGRRPVGKHTLGWGAAIRRLYSRTVGKLYLGTAIKIFIQQWRNGDIHIRDHLQLANGEEIFLNKHALRTLAEGIRLDDLRIGYVLESLKKMQTLALSQRGELIVMLVPSKEEIFGAGFSPGVLETVSSFRRRLKAEQLPFLDLYDLIREKAKLQSPYHARNGHLNSFGNHLVAEYLAARLKRVGLPPMTLH